MRKRMGPLLLLAAAFVVFVVSMAFLLTSGQRQGAREFVLSVTAYGEDTARWRAFGQGIGQACSELDIESPVLALANDADALAERMEREITAGARGQIIAAYGGEELAELLGGLSRDHSVVLAGSPVGDLPCVRADDAAMARGLARQLAETPGNIALLPASSGRAGDALRQEAFLGAMRETGREVTLLGPLPGADPAAEIASLLTFHRPAIDVLVALDTETLEQAIGAYPLSMAEALVYGIGSSDTVVHALTQGFVQGIVFEDEYAIGYLAARQAAAELGLAPAPEAFDIPFFYVDQQSLFDPDKEKLLFPITQ